jgi:hypothetical protein
MSGTTRSEPRAHRVAVWIVGALWLATLILTLVTMDWGWFIASLVLQVSMYIVDHSLWRRRNKHH